MSAASLLRPGWVWPEWSLNKKTPEIEVHVHDPDSGESRWLPGEPQQRVVDAEGNDAFILVRYFWDADDYVEDFDPSRIRRIGSTRTALQEILSAGRAGRAGSDNGHHAHRAAHGNGEMILEAVHAEGVELEFVREEARAIGMLLAGDTSAGLTIGRQHQPEFFDRMVPRRDMLTCISRSHFELFAQQQQGGLVAMMRLLSKSTCVDLRINDVALRPEDVPAWGMSLSPNSVIGFANPMEQHCFLSLRLRLRGEDEVASSGGHPALLALSAQSESLSSPITRTPTSGVGGVLECTYAAGAELERLPAAWKVIPLVLGQVTAIGRLHQREVFEQLLMNEPHLQQYISRSHCRVQLARGSQMPGGYGGSQSTAGGINTATVTLRVENLSMNMIFVAGKLLAKDQVPPTMQEGSTLQFAAVLEGTEHTTFLEFVLRRAKLAS
eukprot:TRINITY_DN121482_c0_g1_i1.p1 TRINITY_DN121482_c0_g1~~TRINITY_DN121482_c0_g1_i1.p1  ORF type:complete len:439 (-),score=84.53 TRINITY_DN121482_c0_g1_i1:492-1808(-)